MEEESGLKEITEQMTGAEPASGTPEPVTPAEVSSEEAQLLPSRPGFMSMFTAMLNGAGVGVLLGILVGLSISPVVSGVIGTISGLLAILLGTSEKYMSPLKSIRIGAFGFFCAAGILTGMYIRTNKGLMPSREAMMKDYISVGFSETEARDFIAYREFGLIPVSWTGKESPAIVGASNPVEGLPPDIGEGAEPSLPAAKPAAKPAASPAAKPARQFANPVNAGAELNNVLYSSEVNSAECYKLNLANSSQSAVVIADKFILAGGTWKEMARDLKPVLPDSIYVTALLGLRDCFCSDGATGIQKVNMTKAVRQLNENNTLPQITQTLTAAGGVWVAMVKHVSEEIPVAYRKPMFLSLVKIFGS